jgi:hypothetical protein
MCHLFTNDVANAPQVELRKNRRGGGANIHSQLAQGIHAFGSAIHAKAEIAAGDDKASARQQHFPGDAAKYSNHRGLLVVSKLIYSPALSIWPLRALANRSIGTD